MSEEKWSRAAWSVSLKNGSMVAAVREGHGTLWNVPMLLENEDFSVSSNNGASLEYEPWILTIFLHHAEYPRFPSHRGDTPETINRKYNPQRVLQLRKPDSSLFFSCFSRSCVNLDRRLVRLADSPTVNARQQREYTRARTERERIRNEKSTRTRQIRQIRSK